MKPSELPRAYLYRLAPELNGGKQEALSALQAEWSRVLPLAFDWFWRPFLCGGLMPRNPARSGPKSTFPATRLVTSQKDLMAVAVEGQAKGWASNLKSRIARSVMRDRILARDTDLRRQLFWLNSMRAWLLPYPAQVTLLAAQPVKADADVNAAKNLARRSGQKVSASAPGTLTNLWVRSVQGWMVRQSAMLLERKSSGLPVSSCAVGCARAGLRALVDRKSSAARLSSESRRVLREAASAPTFDGLLAGFRVELLAPVSGVSTRKSG